jgi:hypothetical protein
LSKTKQTMSIFVLSIKKITILKLNINQFNIKLFDNTQRDIHYFVVLQVNTTLY